MVKHAAAPSQRSDTPARAVRGSILVEDGRVISTETFSGAQYVIRLHAPRIASRSKAGQFVHIRCSPELRLRRPMSIMLAHSEQGWIDILFKAQGVGTHLLSERKAGDTVSLIGPIGRPFKLSGYRRRTLLIGGGVGIPPMVFLADHITKQSIQPFVIMGSEVPFPFTIIPSQILVAGIPGDVIGTMPLLEDWGIACRLASLQGYAGCFEGYVTQLARHWIENQLKNHGDDIEIFACGPTAMLNAVADLAGEFSLDCQISLEEFMACAVGGCAGCAVKIRTPESTAMKRVCVDGPVFEAADVIFA